MLLLEHFEHLTLYPKNAARLKELVLQLAVHGKLTENWRRQNPDVEPTAELLKRIEAEKAQLVKDKKIKKGKELEPISEDDTPYALPSTWTWCRLGDLIEMQYGKSLTKAQTIDNAEFPVYGSNGVVGFYNEYLTSKRTIVIGRKGSAGALNLCLSPSWTTDVAYYVEEVKGLDINFLFRLLKTLNLDKLGKGIKPGLNRNEAYVIPVPLPPLAEQKAIMARVEELMQKIEELEKQTAERIQLKQHLGAAALQQLTAAEDEELEQNWLFLKQHFHTIFDEAANVKKLRETILQLAVQGKLTATWRTQNPTTEPASELLKRIQAEKAQLVKEKKIKKEKPLEPISEGDVPYILPEGWVWCRLGSCIYSAKDGPHFSPQYSERGIPFISTRNVSKDGVDFRHAKYISEELHEEISKKCKPEKGDVLYTKGGTTGIACVNTYDIDFNVWVHVAVLKMPEQMNSFYIKHCLNSPFCYAQSQTLTKGVGNQDLGLTRIVTIVTPLPPLAEQEAIVAKVEQLMQLCDELQQQIQQSKLEAEALMQAVVQEALQVQEEVIV